MLSSVSTFYYYCYYYVHIYCVFSFCYSWHQVHFAYDLLVFIICFYFHFSFYLLLGFLFSVFLVKHLNTSFHMPMKIQIQRSCMSANIYSCINLYTPFQCFANYIKKKVTTNNVSKNMWGKWKWCKTSCIAS